MKFYIDDLHLSFIYESKQEETVIRNYFTWDDYSLTFMRGEFNAQRIKKVCFVRKRKEYNFLYSGFLQEFAQVCKDNEIDISLLEDRRTKFEHREFADKELDNFLPKFDYIEHQKRALKALLKTNMGIIEAAPSAGKSELMIAYIKAVKLPALILVNRVSLCIQLSNRIKENGIDAGFCHGKGMKPGDVMVSTIGSVGKVPDLTKYKILILDEVHRSQAKQFQTFLKSTSYPIRFGFSATPNSGDKYKWALIRQFVGSVICKIEAKELIENKVIVIPRIHMLPVECKPTLDWPSANEINIKTNVKRNKIISNLIKEQNTQTLILVRNIDHGIYLQNEVKGSVFLSGIDDAYKRQEIIDKFEDHEIQVIIATAIFNEGISINAIRLLIIASGGKSFLEAIQRIGRGFRLDPKTGKKEVLIYDFMDLGNRFTERHSELRKKIYQKTGFKVIE